MEDQCEGDTASMMGMGMLVVFVGCFGCAFENPHIHLLLCPCRLPLAALLFCQSAQCVVIGRGGWMGGVLAVKHTQKREVKRC